MRRSLSIFLWILLGACASGIGMGYVLFKAQIERQALHQQIERTQQQTRAIVENHERLIQEANQKIALANAEAAQNRERMQTYEKERALLDQTPSLNNVFQKTKTWNQLVAFPLGISLRIPPETFATTTNDALLATTGGMNYQTGDLWLFISGYATEKERELVQGLMSTSTIAYRIDQTLILGQRGQKNGVDGNLFLLRVQRRGKLTHLIWARTAPAVSEQRFLEMLSTLSFAT